ncbi:U-box domain-containing protein 19-like [Coffea arabica]|uniref:U-box domain-containing protein 19-like n=1 Tax=Coffea arabica TaxID=13443 RepID=A0A6P6STT7_COFAR|nr:U-box domain-containing protein 19-like [Coffea arabica]
MVSFPGTSSGWFRTGNRTCPKTGQRLLCTDFAPNSALKQLIKGFCLEKSIHFADSVGRSRDVTKAVVAGSKVSEQAVRLLANFLVGRLVRCNNQEQNRAAYEIHLLTKTSIFNRSCLVEAGAIPPLLNLLFSCDPSLQENAMASLLNLSKFSKSRKRIFENRGLILILDVLKCGLKVEARQHAAGAFFYLASVEEYRQLIGEIPDAIPSLVELLRDGTDRGKKNALVTIFGLLLCPENHRRVFVAGLVPLLKQEQRQQWW